jgi:hypothetical protein
MVERRRFVSGALILSPGVIFDGCLVGLVLDQGDDHAVQIEEEQNEMES